MATMTSTTTTTTSNVTTATMTNQQSQVMANNDNSSSIASSAHTNYGYYVDASNAATYNSHYYQQYYHQYYAQYAQQTAAMSGYDPQQQYQYGGPVTMATTAPVLPGTSSYLTTTQASYLPSLLTAAAAAGTTDHQQTKLVHNKNSNNKDQQDDDDEVDDDDDDPTIAKPNKQKLSNVLQYRCNEKMGLNPLIYTNIQQSPYFKNNLFQLKTYNEVIDEIFYSVKHLEPWEKGSRKVSGQTGMCGSVRGVGAGGIISTPFCILYKLFTLRLTRKQVLAMIRHKDSPYIRALGFMYIRFTQQPQDLWNWFEPYLDDEEKVDPKAGGGSPMTIGQMVRHLLIKLEWFSTLFPRIPRSVQLEIERKLNKYDEKLKDNSYKQGNNNSSNYGSKRKLVDEERDVNEVKDRPTSSDHRKHHHHYRSHYDNNKTRRSRSRSMSPSSSLPTSFSSNKHRTSTSNKHQDHHFDYNNSNKKSSSRYS